MKRLLLFSALLLTACHASRPHFTVGVSQCSDDAWRQKMNNEMQTEALLYDNLELEIRSAGGDSERQIADIRHFIEQGVDLLIVAPNEAIPVTPVVEEAYARGIPVIVVDRKILSDHYTAYIGADNYRIGKIIGEYVASQLGGRGEVIELTGLSGSTPAIDRHQGFVNALKNHPGIRVLCSEDAHWLRSDAEVRADSLYRIYPEVDLVFAHNDQMALGAWQAAGHTPGGRTVDVVGIDGLPGPGNGIEMVRSGVFKASFIYPTGGERIMPRRRPSSAANRSNGKRCSRQRSWTGRTPRCSTCSRPRSSRSNNRSVVSNHWPTAICCDTPHSGPFRGSAW